MLAQKLEKVLLMSIGSKPASACCCCVALPSSAGLVGHTHYLQKNLVQVFRQVCQEGTALSSDIKSLMLPLTYFSYLKGLTSSCGTVFIWANIVDESCKVFPREPRMRYNTGLYWQSIWKEKMKIFWRALWGLQDCPCGIKTYCKSS